MSNSLDPDQIRPGVLFDLTLVKTVCKGIESNDTRPQDDKTFFMLTLTEHELSTAHEA